MRLKFKQGGTDAVIAVTNVHYCKHIVKIEQLRIAQLADGTLVQRDWYSSFLLYCYDFRTSDIDKDKCAAKFDKCYSMERELIEWIKTNKIKVLNSGIKIA